MDLISHLRSFVAVAESGTFTAAADDIGVAQPVISRRVLALEQHLGLDLFTRAGRRTQLTDAGRLLRPHAADLLARADRLLDLASSHRDRTARLGVPIDADLRALASASSIATERGFGLEVVTVPPGTRSEQLASGSLQIALLDAPLDAADIAVVLGVGSASSQSEAKGPTRPFHLDELRRSRTAGHRPLRRIFLGPEDDSADVRRRLEDRLARAGLSPAQFQVAESVATAVTRVHSGVGVLLCSQQFAHKHGMTWQPLGGAPLPRCYAIGVNPGHAFGEELRQLVRAIAKELQAAVGGVGRDAVDYVSPRSLAPAVRTRP